MILRLYEQDVQISETKTGSLVCATLENHEAVRVSPSFYLGTRYRGGLSFRTFSLAAQRKGTLHQEKPKLKSGQVKNNSQSFRN